MHIQITQRRYYLQHKIAKKNGKVQQAKNARIFYPIFSIVKRASLHCVYEYCAKFEYYYYNSF